MTASVLGAASARNIRASSQKHSQFERKSFNSLSAFGWALLLETALIAGGVYWLVAHPVQPPDKVIPITIDTTAPEMVKPPEPEKPKPPEPPKPILPPPLQPPLSQPKIAPPPVAQLPVAKEAPAAVQPAEAATPAVASPQLAPAPVAAPAPPPPPPPPPAAPSPDVIKTYDGKVTAAAQAAFKVPGSVSALAFKGRTRVGFTLKNGVVSGVTVLQSSGLGAMDRAATQAVQSASYPAPPASLQGKDLPYEVWVTHAPEN